MRSRRGLFGTEIVKTTGSRRTKKPWFGGLPAFLLSLCAPIAAFADDALTERIIAAYSALDSYCDTVITTDYQGAWEFHRCYARDGRNKTIKRSMSSPSEQEIEWVDSEHVYKWHKSGFRTRYYNEERSTGWYSVKPGEFPAGAIGLFLQEDDSPQEARYDLHLMDVVEDTQETLVLEHRWSSPGTEVSERIWIRRADNLIVRGEKTQNGEVTFSATLKEARVNQPLSEDDLVASAPFWHRYSWRTRPHGFFAGMAAASFVAGIVLSIGLRRQRDWRRFWRIYAKGLGLAISVVVVLALLTFWIPGGHPPAIFVPIVMGILGAIAAVLLALLLLGMQFGDIFQTGQESQSRSRQLRG
jgi:hypothetical protein